MTASFRRVFFCLRLVSLALVPVEVVGIYYDDEYPHRYDDGRGGRIGNCAFGATNFPAFSTITYDPNAGVDVQTLTTIQALDWMNPTVTGNLHSGKDRMQRFNNGIPYFTIGDSCPDCPPFYVGSVNGPCEAINSLDFYAVSACADWNKDGVQDDFLLLQEGPYFTKRNANFREGGVEKFTQVKDLFNLFSLGIQDGQAVLQAQSAITTEQLESLKKLDQAAILINARCKVEPQPFTFAGTDQEPWKKEPFVGTFPKGWPTDNNNLNVYVDHCMTFKLDIKGVDPPECPSTTTGGGGGSAFGDPHFVTWGGNQYDFHGGCDLVFLHHPDFHNGLGMRIHIRTRINTWWSSIKAAAIAIGDDVLEITGGKKNHHHHMYWVNGVEGDHPTSSREGGEDFLFSSLGLKVHVREATAKQLQIRIDLLDGDAVSLETFNEFVRVNVKEMADSKRKKKFEGSLGLMGAYPHGNTVGRNGKTVFEDMDAFGQEWQVLESEPKLFRTLEGPQHPSKCTVPTASKEVKRRRLGESLLTDEAAELACADVDYKSKKACIFDVLATNDLATAGVYSRHELD